MMQNKDSGLVLEYLRQEHIPQLVEIEKACFSDPWSYDGFLYEVTNPRAVFLLAVQNGEVLGYIGMHHIFDIGYIANVAVKEAYRRQGVAGFLMEHIMAYAKKNKLDSLTLEVRENNLAAQNFYKNYGFAEVGVRKNYYSNPTEHGLIWTVFL